MSVHVCSLIPIDTIIIRYSRDRKEVMHRASDLVNPEHLNVFTFTIEELSVSKKRSAATIKFLDTWTDALVHSHLPQDEKAEEIRAVQELQYELLWLWDWDESDDLFSNVH